MADEPKKKFPTHSFANLNPPYNFIVEVFGDEIYYKGILVARLVDKSTPSVRGDFVDRLQGVS